MIRVAIFEDNHNLRIGLYQLINGTEGYTCVGSYEDCSNLIKNVSQVKPDVILMDIGLPGINGIEGVRMVKEKFPQIKILMQTVFEDADKIFDSILAGASGYILKNTSPGRILEFIRETYEGGAPMSPPVAAKVLKMISDIPAKPAIISFDLSDREKEILSCLVDGMSYKMIADSCNISIHTVRNHIRNIYEKLHVHSKGEAIAKVIKGDFMR